VTTPDSVPSDGKTNPLKDVLKRAISDAGFCRQLLDQPDLAVSGYALSEVQLLLLRSLDEDYFAKLTPESLEDYFAADSAVYTPEDARMVQQGYEVYDAKELDE